MSSVIVSSLKTIFPDVYNPHKHRKTSKLIAESTKELNPTYPKEQTAVQHDIPRFRKTLRHNICVGMLQEGFHRSFAELFVLLHCWDAPEEHPHKLDTLQRHLTRVETAKRAGLHAEVYDNHLFLAQFFTEPEDVWLKHHFFKLALHSACKPKMVCGRRRTEAYFHMGQVNLEMGELELAQEHFEVFYQRILGHVWQDTSGQMHCLRSCAELMRVYKLLAERLLQKQDNTHAIKMLTKAYEMTKESGELGLKGEAAYSLGLAYQHIGDQTAAKKFLGVFKKICTELKDSGNLGRAYGAIGKSLESEGKQTEAIQYLEKSAEISVTHNQDRNLKKAYMCLGSIFNSRRQYDESCMYYKHAFEIASSLASVPGLQKAQACVGTAQAFSILQVYQKHIQFSNPQTINKIIDWKERGQLQ